MQLAFDIGEIGRWLVAPMVSLPVDNDAGAALLALGIGSEVLLYGKEGGRDVYYCATARVREMEKRADGSIETVRLNKLQWFGRHVLRRAAQSLWESLTDQDFTEIVDEGLSKLMGNWLEPDSQAELASPIPLENYASVAKQVSANFGFRCALTGYFNSNEPLEATPIRPVPDGGRLHVGNFLLLGRPAAYAFSRFQLSVGPSLEIIIDSSLIKSDLLAALNPRGLLTDAPDPLRFVDMDSLAWHRQQFFARLG
jgi:hypothetical protein